MPAQNFSSLLQEQNLHKIPRIMLPCASPTSKCTHRRLDGDTTESHYSFMDYVDDLAFSDRSPSD
jgi:hypothetical protein